MNNYRATVRLFCGLYLFGLFCAPAWAQPNTIADLTLWLRGEDFDDGSNVWTDSGPDGKHTDNAIGDPTTGPSIMGIPTVHFDGDDALHGPNIPLDTSADHTVFHVYANSEPGGRIFSQYAGASTISYDTHINNGNIYGRIGNTAGASYLLAIDANDTSGAGVHLATTTYFGRNSQGPGSEFMELRVDGVLTTDNMPMGSIAPTGDTTQYTLGAIGPPNATEAFWEGGDLAEIITYGRALNAGEYAAVETYLAGRYGFDAPPPTDTNPLQESPAGAKRGSVGRGLQRDGCLMPWDSRGASPVEQTFDLDYRPRRAQVIDVRRLL